MNRLRGFDRLRERLIAVFSDEQVALNICLCCFHRQHLIGWTSRDGFLPEDLCFSGKGQRHSDANQLGSTRHLRATISNQHISNQPTRCNATIATVCLNNWPEASRRFHSALASIQLSSRLCSALSSDALGRSKFRGPTEIIIEQQRSLWRFRRDLFASKTIRRFGGVHLQSIGH